MYESAVNEEALNYNLLFCHACLSSNRTLHSVGDYLDIYLKICDKSRMNLTSQVNICWECMALLKKVQAFKRKVENAQKILDYCVSEQVPLEDNLSDLTLSITETTTFDPILEDENVDEYENYLQKLDKIPEYMDKSVWSEEFGKDELMFKIEDVRGRCDILDVKPMLDLSTSSCDASLRTEAAESPAEEERRHRRWQRSVLLVYKRICSHRYAHHFLRPVSDELAPLYSRIVRRPADLSTIKQRIQGGVIRTTAELTRALLLMFSNALMYNSSDHKIYQMALEFREETLRELSLLQAAHVETECACPAAPGLRRRPASGGAPSASGGAPSASGGAPSASGGAPSASGGASRTPPPPPPAAPDVWDASHQAAPARRSAPAALVRRRTSVWDASHEDVKAAETPRPPRRASLYPEPTAEPAKRRRWDWPCLDNDQYLVANCFKKYKSTVLL